MNPVVGNLMICHKPIFERNKCEVVSLDDLRKNVIRDETVGITVRNYTPISKYHKAIFSCSKISLCILFII